MSEREANAAFEELLLFLRDNRGFDSTGYKRPSLMQRVRDRMESIQSEAFEAYHDYLEVHPEEFAYLFNTILINVTSFFRDPEVWDYLGKEIVPCIIEKSPGGQEVRVWSAGCTAGQEAYSLAMLFGEALGVDEAIERLKVYATDVDEQALTQARQGGYRPEALECVPADLREKYVDLQGGQYVFRGDLRRAGPRQWGGTDYVRPPSAGSWPSLSGPGVVLPARRGTISGHRDYAPAGQRRPLPWHCHRVQGRHRLTTRSSMRNTEIPRKSSKRPTRNFSPRTRNSRRRTRSSSPQRRSCGPPTRRRTR